MALTKVGKIWMNGKWVAWEDAKIHVLSHVLHYASSVFEGIRCYSTPKGPAIFRLEEHMDRLMLSAKVYRMEMAFTREQIHTACIEVVAVNDVSECYIRPLIYRLREPGREPVRQPGGRVRGLLPVGQVPGGGRAHQGHRGSGRLVAA